jgi:hypothetical protein
VVEELVIGLIRENLCCDGYSEQLRDLFCIFVMTSYISGIYLL